LEERGRRRGEEGRRRAEEEDAEGNLYAVRT
jgi:hypothetical protein